MSNREAIEQRTAEAFAASGWQDPRAPYRALLRWLREQDPGQFERALREYEARVVQPVGAADADPVAAWLAYGLHLAELAAGGHAVEIDAEGRSMRLERLDPDRPALVLQMPADEAAAAVVIALPRDPSSAQLATVALLADRLQALPA